MWWASSGLSVVVTWLLFVPGALGFSQIPGSPFATGSNPSSVAFSPSGGLLATANQASSNVSVFSIVPAPGR